MTENEISYKIRGAIFKVYKELGPGLLESIYEAAMCYQLTKDGLFECMSFANAAASIITTRKGALSVMPTQEEITAFLTNK